MPLFEARHRTTHTMKVASVARSLAHEHSSEEEKWQRWTKCDSGYILSNSRLVAVVVVATVLPVHARVSTMDNNTNNNNLSS